MRILSVLREILCRLSRIWGMLEVRRNLLARGDQSSRASIVVLSSRANTDYNHEFI